jgi:hypothetical protein
VILDAVLMDGLGPPPKRRLVWGLVVDLAMAHGVITDVPQVEPSTRMGSHVVGQERAVPYDPPAGMPGDGSLSGTAM